MKRLDYIPACLNLCPLTTFYEGDHNGCQKNNNNNNNKKLKNVSPTPPNNMYIFVQCWIMPREIYNRFLDEYLTLISLHPSLKQKELLICEKLI